MEYFEYNFESIANAFVNRFQLNCRLLTLKGNHDKRISANEREQKTHRKNKQNDKKK